MIWPFRKKKSASSGMGHVMFKLGEAHWSARNFRVLITEGYAQNSTVKRCIDALAQAMSSCPHVLKDPKGKVIESHPLLDFMKTPSPGVPWSDFVEFSAIYYLAGGEAPWWAVTSGRIVHSVELLRPDWLEDDDQYPVRVWRYGPQGRESANHQTIPAEEIKLWKAPNPLSRVRGQSPLFACAYAIDTLNGYAQLNKATLDNGGSPSGIFHTDTNLDDETFNRFKKQVNEEYGGIRNSGKYILTEGGVKFQPIGMSPREFEYLKGKTSNKLDVCEALGVPPQVLGIEGSQTFANYEQARAAMYEDTAIPLYNSMLGTFLHFLGPKFGISPEQYTLTVDIDDVPALEPRRAERMKTIDSLSYLSINEKRSQTGWEDTDHGDVILVPSTHIPLDMAGADSLITDPVDAAQLSGLGDTGNPPADPPRPPRPEPEDD